MYVYTCVVTGLYTCVCSHLLCVWDTNANPTQRVCTLCNSSTNMIDVCTCVCVSISTIELMLEDMNLIAKKQKRGVAPAHTATQISAPHDFRVVSSIVDADMLPDTIRRVKLLKHSSDRPLGFYIRDGTSVRVTPYGLEKVPGIFISRLVPGGLAEGTGLLAVNDEILEVNGIEVVGKSLDQVTDMMVANSQNLIITVKPASQPPSTPRNQPQTKKQATSKTAVNATNPKTIGGARSIGDLPSISATPPTHSKLGPVPHSNGPNSSSTRSTKLSDDDDVALKRHSMPGVLESS